MPELLEALPVAEDIVRISRRLKKAIPASQR
jgi:hypothetical protein